MSDYAFDIKERIREAIDIVELVSRYIPLRRSGQNYVGRCPWHDDSRPSLQVNANRQSFKCWVCDIGGDVFAFVMKVENVGFREALEILADQAGIQLPKHQRSDQAIQRQYQKIGGHAGHNDVPPPHGPTVASSRPQEPLTKKTLYTALDWVSQRYHDYLLAGNEAGLARTYLRDRGINDESIRKFRIGYAPLQQNWLLEQINRDPHRVKIMELVGVLARRDDEDDAQSSWSSQPYDRFRGRLLFPIRDTQDRTIAFGGRLLPGSALQSRAKYVNSPETHLFSKHKQLYGLDLARLTMRNTKRALIMEGYTDVIMAHQFGFGDAVAVLGTALGAEHIRILKRFVDKMVLVLDGDEAGQKRANEVLELFVAQGADIETLTLPGGADPCDFLLTHGSEAFDHELQHNTVDALEHAFLSATQGVDLDKDIIAANQALDKVLGIIALAPAIANPTDPRRLRLEKTIQRLAERFGLPEQEIRKRLRELWNSKKETSGTEAGMERSGMTEFINPEARILESEAWLPEIPWDMTGVLPDALEEELIKAWLIDPDSFEVFSTKIPVEWLLSPITRLVHQVCCEFSDQGLAPTFDRLMTRFDDAKMKTLLVTWDESANEKQRKREQYCDPQSVNNQLIVEIVGGFERRNEHRMRPKYIGRLKAENLSDEDKLQLLLEIQQNQRERHGIERRAQSAE